MDKKEPILLVLVALHGMKGKKL